MSFKAEANIPNDLLERVAQCNDIILKAKQMIEDAENALCDSDTYKTFVNASDEANNHDNLYDLASIVKSGKIARRLYGMGYDAEDRANEK